MKWQYFHFYFNWIEIKITLKTHEWNYFHSSFSNQRRQAKSKLKWKSLSIPFEFGQRTHSSILANQTLCDPMFDTKLKVRSEMKWWLVHMMVKDLPTYKQVKEMKILTRRKKVSQKHSKEVTGILETSFRG